MMMILIQLLTLILNFVLRTFDWKNNSINNIDFYETKLLLDDINTFMIVKKVVRR